MDVSSRSRVGSRSPDGAVEGWTERFLVRSVAVQQEVIGAELVRLVEVVAAELASSPSARHSMRLREARSLLSAVSEAAAALLGGRLEAWAEGSAATLSNMAANEAIGAIGQAGAVVLLLVETVLSAVCAFSPSVAARLEVVSVDGVSGTLLVESATGLVEVLTDAWAVSGQMSGAANESWLARLWEARERALRGPGTSSQSSEYLLAVYRGVRFA